MQKVKLEVDELRVESFATAELPAIDTEPGAEATLACTEKRSCGHICP